MIKVFPGIEELNNFAAEKFIEIGNLAINKNGKFAVALAGGSTPRSLYRLLASENFRQQIDWNKVFFFFSDERNVLPGDENSNFGMARENLFDPLKILPEHIFRWKTELERPSIIAEKYQEEIDLFFKQGEMGFPSFDLILLGMGADGHTASLFPLTEALREDKKIAVDTFVEKLQSSRLTLTFPIINSALNIIFLVAGEEKSAALQQILEGDFDPEKYPAQNVRPKFGKIYWLIDKNVAKLLKNDWN